MTRTKLMDREMPVYTKNEELFNMISHIVGGAVGVALMSAILLAMLQPLATGEGLGHGVAVNELLSSLGGPGHEDRRQALGAVFRQLFLVNAGVGLLALFIALGLPNSKLRGKAD